LKGATLVNECQGLTLLADSLLRQLFYNLIDNTLKCGKKTRRIRVHYQEEENQLKLIYEDDGVGIPSDVKSHLFQKGCGIGTGYGLYLIKRICEAYSWTIEETGKEGQGVQFIMIISKESKDGKKGYEIANQK
jgi:signal transduction histidine kinase